MSIRDEISLLAAGLGDGDTFYTTCPSCERANKFSLSRTDTGLVLYRCFRDSCVLHSGGAISDGGSMVGATRTVKRKSFTPYTDPLIPITDEQREFLYEKIGWDAEHIKTCGVRYAPDADRFALGIRGAGGARRGWVLRSWKPEHSGTKAKTHMDDDYPSLSFYRCEREGVDRVVAVEDIPSAVRASRYVNAVALLGTSCNTIAAWEIAEAYPHIIWALDADATRQAFRLQADHRLLFRRSDVMILSRDLKDETEDNLREILYE